MTLASPSKGKRKQSLCRLISWLFGRLSHPHLRPCWNNLLPPPVSAASLSLYSPVSQDLFVLLDLIGGPSPRFGNQFSNTARWLTRLQNIGERSPHLLCYPLSQPVAQHSLLCCQSPSMVVFVPVTRHKAKTILALGSVNRQCSLWSFPCSVIVGNICQM